MRARARPIFQFLAGFLSHITTVSSRANITWFVFYRPSRVQGHSVTRIRVAILARVDVGLTVVIHRHPTNVTEPRNHVANVSPTSINQHVTPHLDRMQVRCHVVVDDTGATSTRHHTYISLILPGTSPPPSTRDIIYSVVCLLTHPSGIRSRLGKIHMWGSLWVWCSVWV